MDLHGELFGLCIEKYLLPSGPSCRLPCLQLFRATVVLALQNPQSMPPPERRTLSAHPGVLASYPKRSVHVPASAFGAVQACDLEVVRFRIGHMAHLWYAVIT